MSLSISVIMPVCNLQYALSNRIHSMLEVLSELTSDFEILIIDYGSTDLTAEVAADLAMSFPQVCMLDRSELGEPLAVVEDGIQQSTGEFVFVHDASMPFSQQAMRKLWDARDDDGTRFKRTRTAGARVLTGPSSTRRIDGAESLHLMRRSAIPGRRQVSKPIEPPSAFERFTRTDLIRSSEAEETLSPNLAARLRRFVTG